MFEFNNHIENIAVCAPNLIGPAPEEEENIHQIPYTQLAQTLHIEPNVRNVYCWLFCAHYDAMDIAKILGTMDFRGDLVACSARIPNPRMIQQEVARMVPAVSFILLEAPMLAQTNKAYEDGLGPLKRHHVKDIAV
jgi:hypothetical protein